MRARGTAKWRSLPVAERVRVAIVLNQLATPGLGSWLMGHRWAGAGQMLLACAAVGLAVGWFVAVLRAAWNSLKSGEPLDAQALRLAWLQRAVLWFAAAWAWAGLTSLQIWWEMRCGRSGPAPQAPPAGTAVPPRLEGPREGA